MARFIIWLIITLAIHPALALIYAVTEVIYLLYVIAQEERMYRKPPSMR